MINKFFLVTLELYFIHFVFFRIRNNIQMIMSGPLFIELSSCIISIVLELLAIDSMIQKKHIEATFATDAGTLSIHICMVSILCFYAEKFTTQSFDVINTVYSDLLWYKLPMEQRKFIILSICRSQEQFRLDGLGIFNASMETLLKV